MQWIFIIFHTASTLKEVNSKERKNIIHTWSIEKHKRKKKYLEMYANAYACGIAAGANLRPMVSHTHLAKSC